MMIIGKFPDISRCLQMGRKRRVSGCSRVVHPEVVWGLECLWQLVPHLLLIQWTWL